MKDPLRQYTSKEDILEEESSFEVLVADTLPIDLSYEAISTGDKLPQHLSYEELSTVDTLPQYPSPEESSDKTPRSHDVSPIEVSDKDPLFHNISSQEDFKHPKEANTFATSLRAAMQWCDDVTNRPDNIITNFKSQIPFFITLGAIIILLWILRFIYG